MPAARGQDMRRGDPHPRARVHPVGCQGRHGRVPQVGRPRRARPGRGVQRRLRDGLRQRTLVTLVGMYPGLPEHEIPISASRRPQMSESYCHRRGVVSMRAIQVKMSKQTLYKCRASFPFSCLIRSVPNGGWSQCILDEAQASSSSSMSSSPVFSAVTKMSPSIGSSSVIASTTTTGLCGIGKRYRRMDCLDMSNNLAEPKCVDIH